VTSGEGFDRFRDASSIAEEKSYRLCIRAVVEGGTKTAVLLSVYGPQRPFVPVPPSSEGEAITDLQGRVANPIHSDSRRQVHGAIGEEKKPPKD